MVSRKYTEDYRLENVVNPRTGKLVTRPVYRGDLFSFSCSLERVRELKTIYCISTAVAVAAFLLPLFFNSNAGHIFYIMFPYALLVFPLLNDLLGCYRFLTAQEQVTREHRDKLSSRLTTASAATIFFAALSLAGHIIYLVKNQETLLDLLLLVSTLLVLAAGIVMFRFHGELTMTKTGSAAETV